MDYRRVGVWNHTRLTKVFNFFLFSLNDRSCQFGCWVDRCQTLLPQWQQWHVWVRTIPSNYPGSGRVWHLIGNIYSFSLVTSALWGFEKLRVVNQPLPAALDALWFPKRLQSGHWYPLENSVPPQNLAQLLEKPQKLPALLQKTSATSQSLCWEALFQSPLLQTPY